MSMSAFLRILLAGSVVAAAVSLSGNAAAQGAHKPGDHKTGKGSDSRGGDSRSRPAMDASQNLRIRRVEWEGANGLSKPVDFQFSNVPKTVARTEHDWAQIRVTYDTAPEWIDQLVFKYYALLLSKDRQAEKPYSLLETTVTYMDIKKGLNHYSAVYIRPNTLERYGEVVAVGVEITYGDETVKVSQSSPLSKLDKRDEAVATGWWNVIRSNEKVVARDGYLLEKLKTPFALVNYSDYETVRE